MRIFSFLFVGLTIILHACTGNKVIPDQSLIQSVQFVSAEIPEIIPGAERIGEYFSLLKDKRVGLVSNQSSRVGEVHLVDTLSDLGVQISGIFVPEHGYMGKADPGEEVSDSKVNEIPVYSIYGKNKKPKKEDLANIDIMVYDLQDVGVRFYTYCSTLHYVMQACAENDIPLIVLDRPNPNAHYIDGPVLDPAFTSFVGLHPVPVVYGMTIGEYAQMINGEKWHHPEKECTLYIVPCKNYNHDLFYDLPVPPSPNLPNARAIALYPSLCFFEGTTVSVGRGTDMPFQLFGHPDLSSYDFSFTPVPSFGAKSPKHQDKVCYGVDLSGRSAQYYRENRSLDLSYLMQMFNDLGSDSSFFLKNLFFDKLAGTDSLRKQILAGNSEEEIRTSWENGLADFKQIRQKYLIYE